jgi:hypothetical protein
VPPSATALQTSWTRNTKHLDWSAQCSNVARNLSLFLSACDARDGTFNGSALFAYTLNWQSVMFIGYGDDRELSITQRLEPRDR